MKEFIRAISTALNVPESDVIIEIPPDDSMGDIAVPCFGLARILKKSPVEVAKELTNIKIEGIKKTKTCGPYFNAFIDPSWFARRILPLAVNEDYGKGDEKKEIVIEYCAPNTNKPLHLGHLRNIFIGGAMACIMRFLGNTVHEVNLVNDRGIHICKSMLAYKLFGHGKDLDKKGDHFVGDYYVLFDRNKNLELENEAKQMLIDWEKGDKCTRELWKKMNSWALQGIEETLKRLHVRFEKTYYESEFYHKGKDVVLQGYKEGIFEKDENGAIVASLKGMPDKVLLRGDGTSVYITQDIFLAEQKYKDFAFDKSIYVVASEQNLHFQQLFAILKKSGMKWADNCFHLSYGLVNLPTGRMKSREGTVVDADDLLDEVVSLAKVKVKARHEVTEDEAKSRAEIIGKAALIFHLLKFNPNREIIFNPNESIDFEGETGPYVQYGYARIQSILLNSTKLQTADRPVGCNLSMDCEDDVDYSDMDAELKVIKMISRWPNVVRQACTSHKPSDIAQYLINLVQEFNSYYHNTKILSSDSRQCARIVLCRAAANVIKTGLNVLGIKTLKEM